MQKPSRDELVAFCRESNRIEGASLQGPIFTNHVDAADLVIVAASHRALLPPPVLHALLFKGTAAIERERASPIGDWSPHQRIIRDETVHYFPPPQYIEPLMQRWWELVLADGPNTPSDPWWLHHAFESIHPFSDGNGRVGRLLLNNLLLVRGNGWATVRFEEREGYYRSIQHWRSAHWRQFVFDARVPTWENM